MTGCGVDGGGRADLHKPTGIHHSNPVGDPRHRAQVVADEENAHAALFLEACKQRKDLSLNGDVERGRGLVRNQKLGLAGQRHGNKHPLPLPARELVRVKVEARCRVGQSYLSKEASGARARLASRHALVEADRLDDLGAHRLAGVER
jgi:hypothetical protein